MGGQPLAGTCRIVTLRLGNPRRLPQESGFARNSALDQLDTWKPEDRQHRPEDRRRCRDRSGCGAELGIQPWSCAELSMCRRHISASVSRPTRLIRADHWVSSAA